MIVGNDGTASEGIYRRLGRRYVGSITVFGGERVKERELGQSESLKASAGRQ